SSKFRVARSRWRVTATGLELGTCNLRRSALDFGLGAPTNGEIHGPGLPALPAGGHETLLEGSALRRAEVPDRAAAACPEFPAGPARAASQPPSVGVWPAV